MALFDEDRVRGYDTNLEAAEKHHGDAGYNDIPENIPADEETEGATNALETPVASPDMAKEKTMQNIEA